MKRLKILTWVMLLAGLATLTGLVAWQGVDEVAGTIARGGWAMLLLALFFVPAMRDIRRVLAPAFPPGREPGYARAFGAMTVGIYANSLLPLADMGGEVIKARIVMKGGVSGADAGASVVLDKTIQTITLVCWAIIGLLTLLVALKAAGPAIYGGLIAVALLTLGTAGFIVVQHKGMFGGMAGLAERMTGSESWARIAGGARANSTVRCAISTAAAAGWRRPRRSASSGRFVLVGEVWLAAQLIGQTDRRAGGARLAQPGALDPLGCLPGSGRLRHSGGRLRRGRRADRHPAGHRAGALAGDPHPRRRGGRAGTGRLAVARRAAPCAAAAQYAITSGTNPATDGDA